MKILLSTVQFCNIAFVIIVAVLAFASVSLNTVHAADMVTAPAAGVAQSSPPSISCTADFPNKVAEFQLAPPGLYNALIWDTHISEFGSFSTGNVEATLAVYAAVGHPEAGCVPGGSASDYNGIYGQDLNVCDPARFPNQADEHFYIFVNGAQATYVPDYGDHGWYFHGNVSIGALSAGSHSVEFRHAGGDPAIGPSVGYKVAVCTRDIPQNNGCTYTQGWYRNHDWPAGDRNAAFFNSGLSWYEALTARPRGDAYFILAQQYVAAKLNAMSGAAVPAEVQNALAQAESWFSSHNPVVRSNTPDGQTAVALSTILDNYNNGIIGPGHCG